MFNSNPKRATFQMIQTKYILHLLQNCHISKAAGINNLFDRFLKDFTDIITMTTFQICNISIKFSQFSKDVKKQSSNLSKTTTTTTTTTTAATTN